MITMISHGFEDEIIKTGNILGPTDIGREVLEVPRIPYDSPISPIADSSTCLAVDSQMDEVMNYKSGSCAFSRKVNNLELGLKIAREQIHNRTMNKILKSGINKNKLTELIEYSTI